MRVGTSRLIHACFGCCWSQVRARMTHRSRAVASPAAARRRLRRAQSVSALRRRRRLGQERTVDLPPSPSAALPRSDRPAAASRCRRHRHRHRHRRRLRRRRLRLCRLRRRCGRRAEPQARQAPSQGCRHARAALAHPPFPSRAQPAPPRRASLLPRFACAAGPRLGAWSSRLLAGIVAERPAACGVRLVLFCLQHAAHRAAVGPRGAGRHGAAWSRLARGSTAHTRQRVEEPPRALGGLRLDDQSLPKRVAADARAGRVQPPGQVCGDAALLCEEDLTAVRGTPHARSIEKNDGRACVQSSQRSG